MWILRSERFGQHFDRSLGRMPAFYSDASLSCNKILPRGGMNWKLRPPRIKRFAEAGILHPEALGPRDAKSLQIFRFDGGVFSDSSLPKAVYSFRKRGIGNYTPHYMAGQYNSAKTNTLPH